MGREGKNSKEAKNHNLEFDLAKSGRESNGKTTSRQKKKSMTNSQGDGGGEKKKKKKKKKKKI